jgi:endonuclease III
MPKAPREDHTPGSIWMGKSADRDRTRGVSSQREPSQELIAEAEAVLPLVDELLRRVYRTADLGNKRDPLDELVYIQLSIRTREGTYQNIYSALHDLTAGDWGRLAELPEAEILSTLRAGGMAAVKLHRLREQLATIRTAFGRATLEPLRHLDDATAERFLTSLEGVGKKAARCVLLYSLDRPVFPVDSHCRRILARLGFLPGVVDRKAADDYLQKLVQPPLRHTLHVNLVHHGRARCLPAQPRCADCVLLPYCPAGQGRLPPHPPAW